MVITKGLFTCEKVENEQRSFPFIGERRRRRRRRERRRRRRSSSMREHIDSSEVFVKKQNRSNYQNSRNELHDTVIIYGLNEADNALDYHTNNFCIY